VLEQSANCALNIDNPTEHQAVMDSVHFAALTFKPERYAYRKMISFEEKYKLILPTEYKAVAEQKMVLELLEDTWDIIIPDELEFYLQQASDSIGFPVNGIPLAHNWSGDYLLVFPVLNSEGVTNILFKFNHETEEIHALQESAAVFLSAIEKENA